MTTTLKGTADAEHDGAPGLIQVVGGVGPGEGRAQRFVGDIGDVERDLRLGRQPIQCVARRHIELSARVGVEARIRNAVLVGAGDHHVVVPGVGQADRGCILFPVDGAVPEVGRDTDGHRRHAFAFGLLVDVGVVEAEAQAIEQPVQRLDPDGLRAADIEHTIGIDLRLHIHGGRIGAAALGQAGLLDRQQRVVVQAQVVERDAAYAVDGEAGDALVEQGQAHIAFAAGVPLATEVHIGR